jgi:hypothetical protein
MSDQPETAELEQPRMPDPVEEAGVKVKVSDARAAAQMIPVGERGFITPKDFAQVADIAKAMANSKEAVPIHVRGNLGMSIALHDIAMSSGFSPYMLANESSVIGGRLGFTSHVFRGLLNRRGNLRNRLDPKYEGDGDDMTCTVVGHFKDQIEPVAYTTPPLKEVRPARNEKGEVKGSQLWDKDPKRQLFYYASRAFVRMYAPEVMLGIHGIDELQDMVGHVGAENAIDVTKDVEALAERLKAQAAQNVEGFSQEHVEKVLNHKKKKKAKARRR